VLPVLRPGGHLTVAPQPSQHALARLPDSALNRHYFGIPGDSLASPRGRGPCSRTCDDPTGIASHVIRLEAVMSQLEERPPA